MILGGLLGVVSATASSLLPDVVGFFKAKQQNSHELAMLDRTAQIEANRDASKEKIASIESAAALAATTITAGQKDAASSRSHEVSILAKAHPFIISMAASVRPVMAYTILAVFVYVVIKVLAETNNHIEALTTLGIMEIVFAVTFYYFTNRTIEKRKR